jgi:hypothetical protein
MTMFEMERDDRIRGIDETTAALSMAMAHDFLLEALLTREMLSIDAEQAELLSHTLVERWQRRYGDGLAEGSGESDEAVRLLYATKAFVDRLARKALRRSSDIRNASEPAAKS